MENERNYLTREEINAHKARFRRGITPIAVYCGTYHKYNSGNLFGIWVDLASFNDSEELLEFCRRYHAGENDPELMFQDYCGFPSQLYREAATKEDFDKIYEWIDLEDSKKDACEEYWEHVDKDAKIEDILECKEYDGPFSKYANEKADERLYDIAYGDEEALAWLQLYFNYKEHEDDLKRDFNVTPNFVFNT